MIDKLGLDGLGGASVRKPEAVNKLTTLIEAAKAATPGPWETRGLDKAGQAIVGNKHLELFTCWHHSVGSIEKEMRSNSTFIALANPAIILELCALLNEAHDSMEAFTDPEGAMPADTGEFRDLAKALAAIKQWRQT